MRDFLKTDDVKHAMVKLNIPVRDALYIYCV